MISVVHNIQPLWDVMTPLIEQSYEEMYGVDPDEPTLAPTPPEAMQEPRGHLLQIAEDGEVAGIGGWTWLSSEKCNFGWPERVVEVHRVFIRKEFRGRGLGRRLNLGIIEDARAAGAQFIVAETGNPQVEALATYRSLGYREIEPFGELRDNPTSNFFGMDL